MRAIRELAAELQAWKSATPRTPEQIQAWLDERIPIDESDRRERYKCLRCRDTGLVTVLSTIKRIGDLIVHSTGVAQCPCDVGMDWQRRAANPLPMFDDVEMVRIRPGATGEEAAAALREARHRRTAKLAVPEFQAWNERAFA